MTKEPLLKGEGASIPESTRAFSKWLASQPREWSVVIAARAAMRVLPLIGGSEKPSAAALQMFRATAVARLAAKYPNRTNAVSAARAAADAAFAVRAPNSADTYARAAHATITAAARSAATAARSLATNTHSVSVTDAASFAAAARAASLTASAADVSINAAIKHDAERLQNGTVTSEQLARDQLWPISAPAEFGEAWQRLSRELVGLGSHWLVWIDWYQGVALHEPHRGITEAEEAAFTDIPGELPWGQGVEAVNTEIARRLRALHDPPPIEGIQSPIAISRRADGRIGIDAGGLAVAGSLPPEDHAGALAACCGRAQQLRIIAASPQFQGRSEYAEALSAYIEWLPSAPGTGNILLADGEARVLNKLFTADEGILPTGFAGRLSVLLEDHIGLRTHYPELERHYHAVRTGRLTAPLARDAVEAIRTVIHAHTPDVFHESVAPAIDEIAKPVPDAKLPLVEDAPPSDLTQPKPPKDPIAEVDPAKSRNLTFASAANRIWEILLKGKDLPQAIEGWQKTYDQFKPHIGTIIDWLTHFLPGGGDGMPPMPPTLSA